MLPVGVNEHCVLVELFTDEGTGTKVTP